jgi:hypothetical protein
MHSEQNRALSLVLLCLFSSIGSIFFVVFNLEFCWAGSSLTWPTRSHFWFNAMLQCKDSHLRVNFCHLLGDSGASYGRTARGHIRLFYRGYSYNLNNCTKSGTKFRRYWRCSRRACPGWLNSLIENGCSYFKVSRPHDHPPEESLSC